MSPHQVNAAIHDAGFTQRDVAKRLGVSAGHLNLVIRGKKTSRRVTVGIARLLKRPVDSLFPGRFSRRGRGAKG